MKHILKKGIKSFQDLSEIPEGTQIHGQISQELLKSKTKDQDLIIATDRGEYIKALTHNVNGTRHLIPFPDLTLVYFDSAYNLNIQREEFEKKVLKGADGNKEFGNVEFDSVYKYYGYSSSSIIALFTTLECFVNHMIPDDFEFEERNKRSTTIYDKEQIQKYLSIDKKLENVLPEVTKTKSFKKAHPQKAQHIDNLKDIRDRIVHPKSSAYHREQEDLIKRIINFKFDKAFDAVAAFLNYYQPGYIEECTCGADY